MKILVTYGTLSGNTQVVAESIGQHLLGVGHEAEVKNQDEIEPDTMITYPLVIIGGSTWGEGESNPSTIAFMDKIIASQADYSKTKFAIFGLGETNYAHFCAVVDHLSDALKKRNANIVGDPFKIDGYPDENILSTANTWAENVVKTA